MSLVIVVGDAGISSEQLLMAAFISFTKPDQFKKINSTIRKPFDILVN